MSTKSVVSWLIEVGRPVLGHLASSTLMRHIDQLLSIALFAIGIGAVARPAAQALGVDTGPDWLPASIGSLAVIFIVIALLKSVSRYLEMFWCHLVAFKALELLRVRLYRALVPQASTIGLRSTSGDLLTRATRDIDRIEVFFAHTFPPAVTAVTIPLIGLAGIGFWLDWALAGVAAVGLLVSVLVIPLLGSSRLMSSAQDQGALRGRMSQHVTDTIQGMAEVTGYGHATDRLAQQAALDEEAAKCARPRARLLSARQSMSGFVLLATIFAVSVTGIGRGTDFVSLAICVAIVWRLFDATEAVRDFTDSLDTSLACARRVYAIVTADAEIRDDLVALPEGALGIEVDSLTYRYPAQGSSRPPALQDVTVDIDAGSHVALIGASGCGKSTLLRLIAGIASPTSGEIRVGGFATNRADLRPRVALVEQQPMLFNGTVADNLRLVRPDADTEKLTEVLRVACLSGELGLDDHIGPQGKKISGGQAQRLSLAMALLLEADVYLLDEYTSHLNPQLAAQVRRSLRDWAPDATIVEATHTAAGLAHVDQVIVLETRLLAAGRPEELRDAGPLAELIASQRISAGE